MVKRIIKKVFGIIVTAIYTTSLITTPTMAEDNKIINSSFKNWLDGWNVKGDVNAATGKDNWGYDDSYSLGYWNDTDYEVWTEQTITGIENGYYRVEAYAASGGNQEAHYLYANDFGGTGARTSIPITNEFTKVVLNFEVTNNSVTIGFYSKGRAGTWSNYDCISLVKTDEEYKFLKGGDLTMVNYIEDLGGRFYDSEGEERDVFHILAESGFNFARLRTHNDTGREHGSVTNPNYYLPDGYQNTEDLLKSARRAKEVGMEIEVTLNYSDWWPNGATQEIPSSWRKEIEGLENDAAVDKLEELVYEYTKEVMQKLVDQGTTPEYISLGNEMQYGILYPYGRVSNFEQLARFLNAGYRAVKEISTNTKVVLHLDEAGEDNRYTTFLDGCIENNVNYDIIGASYYPFWTKKNVEDIIPWFNELSQKYNKKILIMETGYNWNPTKPDGWPGQLSDNGNESHKSSPQGQKEFLDELFNGIRNAENNCIIGDLYWDPVMIAYDGVGWAMERGEAEDGSEDKAGDNVVSNTTLFDFDGKALPSLNSFRDNTEGTTKGIISGIVTGENGNKIVGAEVVLNINNEKYVKTTDKYGRFFMNEVEASYNNSITVSKDGYSSSTKIFDVVQGEVSKIEIVLGSGSVQGKITDENNNPIEGAEVYSVIGEKKFSTISKADGTYILGDLPAGDNYKINVKRQGYESTYADNIKVSLEEDTNGIDFKLIINSGAISGVVKDNEGNIVSGVTITAVGNDNKEYKAVTDENGKYKIEYIEIGDRYNVTATKEGYLEMSVSNIKVNKGSTTEEVNFELEKALGSITGIVVDNNNNKVSGAKVTISLKEEEKFVTTSDENGIFEIKDVLYNKNYVILCEAEGYGAAKLSNVEVKPSLNKEVILRMSERIVLENWDFEIGTLEGWNVEGDINAVQAQDRTWFGNDAPSGKYALSVWSDKEFNVNINQKVKDLNCGKYELSAWVYSGGDYNSDFMYIRQGEKVTEFKIGHTNNVWQKISIPVWINSEDVEIGFDFHGKSGCWTVIDSIELNYITNINYDELEDVINNLDLIDEKEYTPKSWNELTNNINEAKKLMVSAEVTQEKIDEAVISINNAINSLIKKVDKTELLLLVEEYKDIDKNKYTEESFNEYKKVLAIANELINDEDATEEEVNSIIALLKEKYNLLEEVINESESINPDDEDIESNSNITNENNKDEIIIKVEENDKGNEIKNDQLGKLPKTGEVIDSQAIGLLGVISVIIGVAFLKGKISKIQNL